MIYDTNAIDIEAVKRDGGVELYIILSKKFDDSLEQQNLLIDKIENYVKYTLSDDFKNAHPDDCKEKTCIFLILYRKPSKLLISLCKKILSSVNSQGIDFKVVYKVLSLFKKNIDLTK